MMRISRFTTNNALCAVALLLSQVHGVPSFFRREISSIPTSHPSSGPGGIDTLNLTSSERIALFGDTDTKLRESYGSQRCYSLIYDQVKAGCARDSDMHPDERMLASALLTICDLRASNQSIPWECDAAQNSAHVLRTQEATLGSCVEYVRIPLSVHVDKRIAYTPTLCLYSEHCRGATDTGLAIQVIYERFLRCALLCSAGRTLVRHRSHDGFEAKAASIANRDLQLLSMIDRARDLYRAATQEKIALLRFWRQNAQDAADASNADRIERKEWLRELSLLRTSMRNDLQTILSAFTASLETHDEGKKGIVDLAQSIEASRVKCTLLKVAAEVLVKAFEDATLQLLEKLQLQMSTHLQNIMEEHSLRMEQSVHHHLSTASVLFEKRLVAPIDAANQLAALLQMHTDALQLALQNQHGLVSVLDSASDQMLHHQEAHAEQLSTEIDALRQLQSGFQSIKQDMNATHANIGSLLLSHRSRWSIWSEVLFPSERLVVRLTHGFVSGANLNHCEHTFNSEVPSKNLSFADLLFTSLVFVLRCLRWLLPALLTGTIILARLYKNILLFFYSRSMSWIRGKLEAKVTTDKAQELEPSMSDSWHVIRPHPRSPYHAEIATRNAVPYEARKQGHGDGQGMGRCQRIHCPSRNCFE
ncbi:uncharacterized protein UTRI_04611 [Ustilago trichophora]|uniref:Nuclear fusion protein KAR5 n=1 Tax=Ustilago trichophora TaxID=86804 RepID=A0A5C3EDP8_9BASI|nr:uncharacterized protein UTRI_04611 [Ustilago trichophora]